MKPLLALGACLALCSVYLLFGNERKESKSTAEPASSERAADAAASNDSLLLAAETLAEFQAENPKEAEIGEAGKPPIVSIGRNLFADSHSYRESDYETVKIAPSPPKPSVELHSIAPDSVCARAKKIELSVRGGKFAPDMKVYVNGSEAATDFVSTEELRTTLSAQTLASPQSLQIEVKKPASAAVFSNKLEFKVTPLPFAFSGQISDDGDRNARFVISSGKEYFTVAAGEIFEERWRVTGVSGDYLEIEDVRLGSRHTLMSGEQPAQASKTEKTSKQPDKQPASIDKQQTEPANGVNLFERKANPMTYNELLKKRSEAARRKQK